MIVEILLWRGKSKESGGTGGIAWQSGVWGGGELPSRLRARFVQFSSTEFLSATPRTLSPSAPLHLDTTGARGATLRSHWRHHSTVSDRWDASRAAVGRDRGKTRALLVKGLHEGRDGRLGCAQSRRARRNVSQMVILLAFNSIRSGLDFDSPAPTEHPSCQ